MKRLVVVLSSLLVLPAFAEIAPSAYDVDTIMSDAELGNTEYTDQETVVDKTVQNTAPVAAKPATRGTSRSIASARMATTPLRSSRGTPTRSISAARAISSRGASTNARTTNVANRQIGTGTTTSNVAPGRTVTTKRPGNAARASVVTSSAPLYNSVSSRGASTRSSIVTRGASMRAASVALQPSTTSTLTADEAAETTNAMNTLKSLTEYCQAQYAACMDNYCNVLDDNQGRCSCSKNLANYQKIETALANATEALQDVARSIQYIGLNKDQITTLFTETEAELTMKDSKDNSAIRSSLDKVKRMIVEVKPGASTSATENNSSLSFDLSGLLNFDIDNTGFDLTSFMGTNGSNTNSISNQRGESLYKTATSRCKASVLNSCTAQGVDAASVTNAYDLEIDKSCIAYERALTDSNAQMTQTVANAKEVLKKARLMVAQNKNSYDLRGCVSALESCMQDDYVCGNGYEGCLDPTGKYIVNGSVVIGSLPGNNTNDGQMSSVYSHDNLFSTWLITSGSGNSAKIQSPWGRLADESASSLTLPSGTPSRTTMEAITLYEYIDSTVTANAAKSASDKMSEFLQYKIGYHDDKNNKDYGMCMSVLNKCQAYTYDTKGKYNPTNDVIKQFLQRALVQIKSAQDEVLASYAEDCISDVSSCLSSNGFEESNTGSTKSRTAINSCYAQIKTCFSVNGNIYGAVNPVTLSNWVVGTFSDKTIFSDTNDITLACSNITDPSECNNLVAYCWANGTTTQDGVQVNTVSFNELTSPCQWEWNDDDNHDAGGSCRKDLAATCGS